MKIGAIVLAAGRSSRFEGGNKLLSNVAGVPLVRRVLEAVAVSSVSDIVLITSPEGAPVVSAAGAGRWRTIINADAAKGLSSSIRAGLAGLDDDVAGALVVLADMPGVDAALINRLTGTFANNCNVVVYPADADGRQGHPVLWPRQLFLELMRLEGDKGGKGLIEKHAAIAVPASNPGAFDDIDTREDLYRIQRGS